MRFAKNILFIPLDDRPCCLLFPKRLAAMCGCSLVTPPRNILGNLQKIADMASLESWFISQVKSHKVTLASLDMLVCGGLVASRNIQDNQAFRKACKSFSRVIASSQGKINYFFSTVMRPAPTQKTAQEVKTADNIVQSSVKFAEKFGRKLVSQFSAPNQLSSNIKNFSGKAADIFASSGTKIKDSKLFNNSKTRQLKRLFAKFSRLSPALSNSYLAKRLRKHELNRYFVELMPPTDTFLLIGKDDSKTKGLNICEAQALQKLIDSKAKQAKISTGTDELAMLLLARTLVPGTEVTLRWAEKDNGYMHTLYEDLPLEDVLKSQAQASAAVLTDDAVKQLWIYAPYEGKQVEASMQPITSSSLSKKTNLINEKPTKDKVKAEENRKKHLKTFVDGIEQAVANGAQVAVADVAYANGADNLLVKALTERGLLNKIASYAAWNTAGNALGTALAALLLLPSNPTKDQKREQVTFLLERLADDYLYQANLRIPLSSAVGGAFVLLEDDEVSLVSAKLHDCVDTYVKWLIERYFNQYKLSSLTVSLPWKRAFEAEIEINLEDK